jgi:hypothetical protein
MEIAKIVVSDEITKLFHKKPSNGLLVKTSLKDSSVRSLGQNSLKLPNMASGFLSEVFNSQ